MSNPIQFFETGYGRAFFSFQLPQLVQALSRIATLLERAEKRAQDQELQDRDAKGFPASWNEQDVRAALAFGDKMYEAGRRDEKAASQPKADGSATS